MPASLTSGYAVPADDVAPARPGDPLRRPTPRTSQPSAKVSQPFARATPTRVQRGFPERKQSGELSRSHSSHSSSAMDQRFRRSSNAITSCVRSALRDSPPLLLPPPPRRGDPSTTKSAETDSSRAHSRRECIFTLARELSPERARFPRFRAEFPSSEQPAIPICDLPRAIKRITVAPARSRVADQRRPSIPVSYPPASPPANSVKGARARAWQFRRGGYRYPTWSKRSVFARTTGCDLSRRAGGRAARRCVNRDIPG